MCACYANARAAVHKKAAESSECLEVLLTVPRSHVTDTYIQ